MKEIKRFGNGELFGIKVRDNSVRTGTKVAVLGRFAPAGGFRPGFKVNLMSTEGVAGTAQVIRFENVGDAQRWISEKGEDYGHDLDDYSIMNNRTQEFIRLPLCDFNVDVWVNSNVVDRFSRWTTDHLLEYCPEYFDDDETHIASDHNYRGFNF